MLRLYDGANKTNDDPAITVSSYGLPVLIIPQKLVDTRTIASYDLDNSDPEVFPYNDDGDEYSYFARGIKYDNRLLSIYYNKDKQCLEGFLEIENLNPKYLKGQRFNLDRRIVGVAEYDNSDVQLRSLATKTYRYQAIDEPTKPDTVSMFVIDLGRYNIMSTIERTKVNNIYYNKVNGITFIRIPTSSVDTDNLTLWFMGLLNGRTVISKVYDKTDLPDYLYIPVL